jgi:diguanylate cyclase (GGDEF)-like protein
MKNPAMKMRYFFVLKIFIVVLFAGFSSFPVFATSAHVDANSLIEAIEKNLKIAPEKTPPLLAQLQTLEPTLSTEQKNKFYILQARSLGLRGRFKEQVSLIEAKINQVEDVESRALFLYYLSEGYASLGNYEHALKAMNDGIVLLPKLQEIHAKVGTLLAAVALFNSLDAYDDALLYANRIYAIESSDRYSVSKCMGSAEIVETNFLRGDSKAAYKMLSEAIDLCNGNGRKIIVLMLKSTAATDLIDTGHNEQGLSSGLPVLLGLSKSSGNSHYVTKLEEAIARAYLRLDKLALAERYGFQAYQRAAAENMLQLMEKTSETMAKIKRAQGQQNSAYEYYDINLALKKKVLDDRLQKNLAYQRVKFDIQDKANELTLLAQKNKLLTTEKQLQFGKNQNLLLLITLGTILLTLIGVWLIRTLQLKNFFRTSSQIDGLTLVSNRAHFVATATQVFKNPETMVSLVLFDMDQFKKINDTFGHATGDWVLKTVTATVTALLSKGDLFGRLGGEEFAICLPGANEADVLALAERCRSAIATINTEPSGYAFPISASFGMAMRGKHKLINFEDTLAAADKALYVSKNEGRNRVSVYE